MANKKKIEEREKVLQTQQTERTIRLIGIGVVALIAVALIFMYFSNRSAAVPTEAPITEIPITEVPQTEVAQPEATQETTTLFYAEYPPMTIDPSKEYLATFRMAEGGEFTIQLFPDKAPKTVNSFVFLARQGYFDGLTFHRVLQDFMAQGGDPTGTGSGGPGYEFENEDNDLTFDKAGVVAMANAGRDTNGSQFFITFGPTPHLDGGYTIFGQVIEGMDVVSAITLRDPDMGPTFAGDVMESVTITEQ